MWYRSALTPPRRRKRRRLLRSSGLYLERRESRCLRVKLRRLIFRSCCFQRWRLDFIGEADESAIMSIDFAATAGEPVFFLREVESRGGQTHCCFKASEGMPEDEDEDEEVEDQAAA